MKITAIDRNFQAVQAVEEGYCFIDVKQEPMCLEGLAWGDDYFRIPRSFTTSEINRGAKFLANHTSGVCVRFRSDSPEIRLRAELRYGLDMNHMTRCGSCGFDCYRRLPGGKLLFNKSVQPDPKQKKVMTVAGVNPERKLCDWVIHFPLYGGVRQVSVGVQEGARVLPPRPHRVEKPVLFYGSSITQGGCASRPGNMYPSLLGRRVDAPIIDLGFSGSGKGEIAVARAIAELELSAFVMDYDHNAPDAEHLRRTHEPFFLAIREKQPHLPVIMMSRCDFYGTPGELERREIIRTTWQHAVDNGDRCVYFIDGETLFGGDGRDACTVDGCHPNDLGFYRMYRKILPVLQQALAGQCRR